jgi:uncharacterized protein (TIGR02246 family)
MTPNRMREQIKKAFLFWQTGDAEGFANLFTLDGEFIDSQQQWFGQTSIRNAVTQCAQKNYRVKFNIRRILIDGNVAAIERSRKHEEIPSDRANSEDFIIVDFRNGQISRWREYLYQSAIEQVIGN